MNSTIKRIDSSTSSIRPMYSEFIRSTTNNVDHYYRQLQMLPGGLTRFDDSIANMNFQRNKTKIPEYNFRDHPPTHNNKASQISEYSEQFSHVKDNLGRSQVDPTLGIGATTGNVGKELFASNVHGGGKTIAGRSSQPNLPRVITDSRDIQTSMTPKDPSNHYNDAVNKQQEEAPSRNQGYGGANNHNHMNYPPTSREQLKKGTNYSLGEYQFDHRAGSAKPGQVGNQEGKEGQTRDSLDRLQEDMTSSQYNQYFDHYHRRP